MNPDLKITAFLDKVGPDTEEKYSDNFFEGLDFVVNALDNVNARLYVDSRCVTAKRGLLESGIYVTTISPCGKYFHPPYVKKYFSSPQNVSDRPPIFFSSPQEKNSQQILGTLGPKGHVQVVIPHFTESYGSQRDPPEKDVPFCTLKSFPNQIEHCIEWARDFSFGGLFVSKPMQWKQLVEENKLVEVVGGISRVFMYVRN
jgi:hypothetical protein